MAENADRTILAATTQIVTAWLAANTIPPAALAGVIRSVYQVLAVLTTDGSPVEPEKVRAGRPLTPRPAVDIRKSVFPDHLICLEDGKKVTMLKRHLNTAHGLTPELYRIKWGLASNYPMVAPNYAKIRSGLAKAAGLGKGAGK